MSLRAYQQQALADLHANAGQRPVLVLPTGGGKTRVASAFVAAQPGRTLWLTHRRELVQQAFDALTNEGLTCGRIQAGAHALPSAPVQVASVQTLARRTLPSGVACVVVDECHHARAASWRKILDAYPNAIRVGLTATPQRLDGRGLGDLFGTLVVGVEAEELVRQGFLVAPTVYVPDDPDLSGVRRARGDYAMGQLAAKVHRPKLVADIVSTWQSLAAGRPTLCFAVSRAHSEDIVGRFQQAGVRAAHVDGRTPRTVRDAVFRQLRTGQLEVVSNVGLVEEGFDLPALEVVILARPTQSLAWHLQAVGRAVRAATGKAGALVLDHAGNHLRHGEFTDHREWSLDGDGVKHRDAVSLGPPVKRCLSCFLLVPAATKTCPGCGAACVTPPRVLKERKGALTKLQQQAKAPSLAVQQAAWDAAEARRVQMGFRPGWSYFEFERRMGFKPLVVNGKVIDLKRADRSVKEQVYREFEAQAKAKGYKPGWAGFRYKQIFGTWPRFRRKV